MKNYDKFILGDIMHVIITGAARAGKTTLSLMLNEYGFTHYKMDSVKRGICESEILDPDEWDKVSSVMCTIINRIIEDNKTDTNYLKEKYLFDTPFLYPKDIKLINTDDTMVVFLGHAHISVEDKMKLIRENDEENYWTNKINDEELRRWTSDSIEFSKYLEEECKKLGLKYYDTSENRDLVLKQVLNDIINS